jgi:hypothetical protein
MVSRARRKASTKKTSTGSVRLENVDAEGVAAAAEEPKAAEELKAAEEPQVDEDVEELKAAEEPQVDEVVEAAPTTQSQPRKYTPQGVGHR